MADNIVLNSGSGGDTAAADDIGGIKFQRIKLIHGADGTNDGDVSSTNGLPIKTVATSTIIETTTTPLTNGSTYTTATFDTITAGHGFTVSAKADQNGHTYHDQSINGTDWISADDYVYTANEGHHEEHIAHMRYTRFRFVNNSGSNQTSFVFSVVQRFMDSFGTVKIAQTENAVSQDQNVAWTTKINDGTDQLAINADGSLDVGLKAGTNNIGDVDVLSLPGTVVAGMTSLPAGTNNIGDVDILSLPNEGQQTMANSISIAVASDQSSVPVTDTGNVAHDGVDSGNPVKIGLKALNAVPTAVSTNADRTDAIGDFYGQQFIRTDHINSWSTANTGALSATSVKGTPGAGLSLYVTGITFSIGAATASSIKLTISGGADIWGPHYLEAVAGRGITVIFPSPLKVTANTALVATTSGSTTCTLNTCGFTAP